MTSKSPAIVALAAALVAALAAQTPVPVTSGTSAISGVITDAATGRSIAGAVVALRRLGPPASGSAGQQVTDARGRFVFDELIASKNYVLDASRPGYMDGHYLQLSGVPISTRFALADGQWVSNANIELSKLGAIGGLVTDEFGEPVVGALVRAIAEITVAGRRELAAARTAKTDDRGEYRLSGLLPARYVVMLPSVQHSVPASTTPAQLEGIRADMYAAFEAALARNPATSHVNNGAAGNGGTRLIIGNFVTPPAPVGGRDRAYPITFAPGAMSMAGAATIDLSNGEEKSGVNMSIQPVAAVRVSGHLDGMTTPARLTLRLVPAGLEGLGSGSEAATTIVNADGTFAFLSVPAGAYTLEAGQSMFEFTADTGYIPNSPTLPRTPGQETLGRQFVDSSAGAPPGFGYSVRVEPPGPSYVGHTSLTVGAADLTDVVVTVQPAVTIRGRFVYEDTPNGPPQRAQVVMAEPAAGNWGLGFGASHPDGPDAEVSTFTVTGVGSGAHNLRCTPGPGLVLKSILIDGQDYSKKPIDVTLGRDINDVVITFTGKVPALSGAVHKKDGTAADRATVIAFSTDRATWPNLGLWPVVGKLALTSGEGTFALSTLPAGDYYVVAVDGWRSEGWTDPGFLAKAATLATRVSLEWGGAKSVDLTTVVVK